MYRNGIEYLNSIILLSEALYSEDLHITIKTHAWISKFNSFNNIGVLIIYYT